MITWTPGFRQHVMVEAHGETCSHDERRETKRKKGSRVSNSPSRACFGAWNFLPGGPTFKRFYHQVESYIGYQTFKIQICKECLGSKPRHNCTRWIYQKRAVWEGKWASIFLGTHNRFRVRTICSSFKGLDFSFQHLFGDSRLFVSPFAVNTKASSGHRGHCIYAVNIQTDRQNTCTHKIKTNESLKRNFWCVDFYLTELSGVCFLAHLFGDSLG